MARPGSSLPLVRRVFEDGVLRELVHPADGGPAVERPVGSGPGAPSSEEVVLGGPAPELGIRRLGQLLGRNVENRDFARPLALPLLRASCDGSGSCCGLYHHVPATSADRERIVPLLRGSWDRPVPLDAVFHPAFDAHPDGPLNVVSLDGCCAFLDGDGLCAVHKAGGAASKPSSCVTYPASFVVCGERWYASLRPECACVARTALEGPRLADDPHGWAHLRSMMLAVWEVPMLVEVLDDRVITRTEYRRFTEDQVAALSFSLDPVRVLKASVRALDALVGTEGGNGRVDDPPSDLDGDGLLPSWWLDAAHEWLRSEAASASWGLARRSPARRAVEWGLDCVQALRAGERPDARRGRGKAADWRRRAALVTAHLFHGHGLLEEDLLRPALVQLTRMVALAEASFLLRPVAEVDGRLEELTAWFFLWRTLGRDVGWEEE